MLNEKAHGTKLRKYLRKRGISMTAYGKEKGMSPQSAARKFKNDSFTVNELVEIANKTDVRVAFVKNDLKTIVLLFEQDPGKGDPD